MSLINQMLKDLESRRAPGFEGGDAVLSGLSPVGSSPRATAKFWITGVCVLIVGALGLTAWNGYLGLASILPENSASPTEVAATNVSAQPESAVPAQIPENSAMQAAAPTVPATADIQTAAVEPLAVFRLATRLERAPIHAKPNSRAKKIPTVTPVKKVEPVLVTAASETSNSVSRTDKAPLIEKRRIVLSPTENAQKNYQEALLLLQANRPFTAETKLKQALNINSNHVKARESLALLYARSRRGTLADSLLAQGLNLDPGYLPFRKLMARIQLSLGDLDAALAVLNQVPVSVDTDTEYVALKAALQQRKGNHQAAAELYRSLVSLNRNNGLGWMGLGISLEALNESTAAREAYGNAERGEGLQTQARQFVSQRKEALR